MPKFKECHKRDGIIDEIKRKFERQMIVRKGTGIWQFSLLGQRKEKQNSYGMKDNRLKSSFRWSRSGRKGYRSNNQERYRLHAMVFR